MNPAVSVSLTFRLCHEVLQAKHSTLGGFDIGACSAGVTVIEQMTLFEGQTSINNNSDIT